VRQGDMDGAPVEVDGLGNPIDRNRWGQYMLPHPETGTPAAWRRVTTFTGMLNDRYALEKWKLRQLAAGFRARPGLLEQLTGERADDDRVVGLALDAADTSAAADEGTRVHGMLAEIDAGRAVRRSDYTPADQQIADVYYQELGRVGLTPVGGHDAWVERVVAIPELGRSTRTAGLAGTVDRWYRTLRPLTAPTREEVPAGSVLIGDIKTGRWGPDSPFEQGSMTRQLAAYRTAQWMITPDGGWGPPPPARRGWGVLVHLNVQTGTAPECAVFWIDLEAGREQLEVCRQVAEIRAARNAKRIA